MGYESKLMVVQPYRHFQTYDNEGKTYVSVVATIDLCKMPYDFNRLVLDHWHDGGYYFYSDDDEVTTDLYGDPLVATDLDTAIADLKEIDQLIVERDGYRYRRLPPAIALLEGFDQSQWDELLVLHFGR